MSALVSFFAVAGAVTTFGVLAIYWELRRRAKQEDLRREQRAAAARQYYEDMSQTSMNYPIVKVTKEPK